MLRTIFTSEEIHSSNGWKHFTNKSIRLAFKAMTE